jgi:hypothetical protein
MKKQTEKKVEPRFDAEQIRDISEAVYRLRLEQPSGGGTGSVGRMIANDKDDGQKLRGRAAAYDQVTRLYLELLGFKPGKIEIPLAVAAILKGVKPL